MHETQKMILGAIIEIQESKGIASPFVTDDELGDRLGPAMDAQQIRHRVDLLVDQGLVDVTNVFGGGYLVTTNARGKSAYRDQGQESDSRGLASSPELQGPVPPLPELHIKLLLAMVRMARRNGALSVLCIENQSAEKIGAIDVHVSRTGPGGDVVVSGLMGSPLLDLQHRGYLSRQGSHTWYLEDAAYVCAAQYGQHSARRIETTLRELFTTEGFPQRYPTAYQKWTEAETALWKSDSEQYLTIIGHLCREAMQHFITGLVTRYRPPDVNPDPDKTRDRLGAVLTVAKPALSDSVSGFLDELWNYWYAVERLYQRQEHGAQKGNEPLGWDDARRVVFHTLMTMVEIDNALQRSAK